MVVAAGCSRSVQRTLAKSVIPKLWPAGHFWPAASYKITRQDLWSRILSIYLSIYILMFSTATNSRSFYSLIVQFIVENCLLTY